MKNIFRVILAVLIAISLLPTTSVHATELTLYENTSGATSYVYLNQVGGAPDYWGQVFQAQSTHQVSMISALLAPFDTNPQGTVYLRFCNSDGTFPTTTIATQSFSAAGMESGDQWVNFTISPTIITNGNYYAIVAYQTGATYPSQTVVWRHGNSGHNENSADGTNWAQGGSVTQAYRVYGYATPSVTTLDETSVTTTTVRLNGNLDDLGPETSVNVYFGWRTATGGIYDYYTAPQTKTTTGTFYADLTGLAPGSTYYYAAFASNATSTWYGDETSFTTGNALAVSTLDPSYITSATAQLNGNLTEMGDYTLVNLGFQYGNSTDYGTNATVTPRVAEGTFNAGITGLAGDTEYHYRAYGYSTNPWTNTTDYAFGVDKVFRTTAGSPANPLTVVTEVATVTDTNATLNGNLTAIGNYIPVVGFRYGEFNGYWTQYSVGTQSATGAYNYTLTGLRAGTTYYFQAYATDANGPVEGAVLAFTTTGTYSSETTLRVTTNMAYQIGDTQARLTGSLNSLGLNSEAWVGFDYGPSTSFGSVTPSVRKTNKGGFDYVISGLTKGRTYYYRAGAIGATGEVAWGETLSFVAGEPVYVPGSPTPTTTPPPSSGTPTPIGPITLPGSWNTTLGRYILLVVLLISVPLLLMYILGGKMGKGLSGIVDSVIFTAWVIQGWVDLWILVTVLIVAGFVVWKSIFSPRGA